MDDIIELTSSEIDILRLLSEGYSTVEISNKKHITLFTTRTHIANIYNKLYITVENGKNYSSQRVKAARYYWENKDKLEKKEVNQCKNP